MFYHDLALVVRLLLSPSKITIIFTIIIFFFKNEQLKENLTPFFYFVVRAAVLRTITLLKVGISKSKERVFTAECLTEVMEDLKQNVEQLNTDNFRSCESSMSGMKAFFLIQSLLDRYVKQKLTSHLHHQTRDINDALVTPETAHGKSKVRSLLTQFR